MQTMFAVGDIVWQSVVGGFFALALAYMNLRLGKISRTSDQTAIKVEEVHNLTNGGLGDQLQIAMVSAVTLAELIPKPEYIALAEVARKKYEAHMFSIKEISDAKKTAAGKIVLSAALLSAILPLVLLLGCAAPSATAPDQSVRNRVVSVVSEWPEAFDYFRKVSAELTALSVSTNYTPEFVAKTISNIRVGDYVSGQRAAVAGLQAQIVVNQIIAGYKVANRQRLNAIAGGFNLALQ